MHTNELSKIALENGRFAQWSFRLQRKLGLRVKPCNSAVGSTTYELRHWKFWRDFAVVWHANWLRQNSLTYSSFRAMDCLLPLSSTPIRDQESSSLGNCGTITLPVEESLISESSSDSDDSYADLSHDDTSDEETRKVRKRRIFLEGNARRRYSSGVSSSLEGSLSFSSSHGKTPVPPSPSACNSCAPVLEKYEETFKGLLRQGSELKRRKIINPNPRKPNFQHYRDVVKQNEWLRSNIFDPMGNFLFCAKCVRATLGISSKRLARLRKQKRAQFSQPTREMTKSAVEDGKLGQYVVMTPGCDIAFRQWWSSLDQSALVVVRYPHERHGLAGRTSNQAKTSVKADFINFADVNSQPSGRREDSTSATHYFLPIFKTIQTPKKGVHHYSQRLEESVVGVFNRVQVECGRGTCSNGSAAAWLKAERPKLAIYPHKSDYCDTCAYLRQSISGLQTSLKRKRHTGSVGENEQRQLESDIKAAEDSLVMHKEQAAKSRDFYNEMTARCKQQWTRIEELTGENAPHDSNLLSTLKHTFTLTLSADYQMSKLIPYWGNSPQPGSTYYLQKLSVDLFGIVDHKDDSAHMYLFDETLGPKNTEHTLSYLCHYIKESDNFPSWVRRVHLFLDNAGNTNKNCHLMSAAMELVQHQVLDYIRISFLIAGNTKFVPDRVFSKVAKTYSCSDVFNIAELASVASNYSSVVIDDGDIVKTWREGTEEKYSKLPGVRSRHDFLIVRHPATNIAIMKVRDRCYDGQFEETSLKLSKGHVPTEMAMPTALDTYKCRGKVKNISATKAEHLQQMYTKFVPVERHPNTTI